MRDLLGIKHVCNNKFQVLRTAQQLISATGKLSDESGETVSFKEGNNQTYVSRWRAYVVIGILSLVTFIASVSTGPLTSSIPTIMKDLSIPSSGSYLPLSVYGLTRGASLLVSGSVADGSAQGSSFWPVLCCSRLSCLAAAWPGRVYNWSFSGPCRAFRLRSACPQRPTSCPVLFHRDVSAILDLPALVLGSLWVIQLASYSAVSLWIRWDGERVGII